MPRSSKPDAMATVPNENLREVVWDCETSSHPLCCEKYLEQNRNAVTWLVIVLICVALGCIAFIVWRKWIAPWQQLEQVITQIGRGERPRTFLMAGGAPAQRIGFQLEKIVGDRSEERRVGKGCRCDRLEHAYIAEA